MPGIEIGYLSASRVCAGNWVGCVLRGLPIFKVSSPSDERWAHPKLGRPSGGWIFSGRFSPFRPEGAGLGRALRGWILGVPLPGRIAPAQRTLPHLLPVRFGSSIYNRPQGQLRGQADQKVWCFPCVETLVRVDGGMALTPLL